MYPPNILTVQQGHLGQPWGVSSIENHRQPLMGFNPENKLGRGILETNAKKIGHGACQNKPSWLFYYESVMNSRLQ